MKTITLWLLAIFLGMTLSMALSVPPIASAGSAELLYRYMSDDGLIVSQSSSSGEDLVVNDENPWVSRVFQVEEVWPGDSANVTLKLQNVGDNGTLHLHLLNLVDELGITPEPEPTPDLGEFSQNLDMLIWWDDNQNSQYEAGESKIAEGKLKNIVCITYGLGALNWMETKYLGIGWSVAHSVGNEIIGDKCTFDIQFVLD
jgi:hypothetical protein